MLVQTWAHPSSPRHHLPWKLHSHPAQSHGGQCGSWDFFLPLEEALSWGLRAGTGWVRVRGALVEESDVHRPAASPGPLLIAGALVVPGGAGGWILTPCRQRPLSLAHRKAGLAASAAVRLERSPDACGQGLWRGALGSAAHGQALGGQGARGGGADGCELQRREGLSARHVRAYK